MRARDAKIAERLGVLERCKAFEEEILKIKDIVPDTRDDGVPFDLTGLCDECISQVIIVPKYDIRSSRSDYWDARKQLKDSVIAVAEKYDLYRTGDRIEDYGEHFYFVFCCGQSWKDRV